MISGVGVAGVGAGVVDGQDGVACDFGAGAGAGVQLVTFQEGFVHSQAQLVAVGSGEHFGTGAYWKDLMRQDRY